MNIILFTDQFPFGVGEKAFVGPEVDFFSERDQLTIVCMVDDLVFQDEAHRTKLPKNVQLVRLPEVKKAKVFLDAIPAFFCKEYLIEAKDIIKEGKLVAQRLFTSYKYLVHARMINRMFKRSGIYSLYDDAVYYSYWMAPYCLALCLEKEAGSNLKIVSRTHNYDLYNERAPHKRQPFQRFKAAMCDKVLFVAPLNRDYFVRSFFNGEDNSKFEVCRLGCLPCCKVPPKKDEPIFRIVSCSYVKPIKRVDLIAKAISRLPFSDVEWVHFGDGPCLSELKKIVAESKINAHFPGFVSNESVHAYYQENYVDVFVTTSAAEGSPVSVQEAMAYGIPVVGTSVGGIPEQIEGNGVLLSPDPEIREVVQALSYIHDADETMVAAMRAESKKIWGEKYNREENLERLRAVLLSVLEK